MFAFLALLFGLVCKPRSRLVWRGNGVVLGLCWHLHDTTVAVEFTHLAQNHGKVGHVCGFDHSHLDTVQTGWQQHAFCYPVWMYDLKELTARHKVWDMDFATQPPASTAPPIALECTLPVTKAGTAHAVVLWVDYQLLDGGAPPTMSTGLLPGTWSRKFKTARCVCCPFLVQRSLVCVVLLLLLLLLLLFLVGCSRQPCAYFACAAFPDNRPSHWSQPVVFMQEGARVTASPASGASGATGHDSVKLRGVLDAATGKFQWQVSTS